MPSIEIKPAIKIGMEDILEGIAHLETADLENFLQEVAYLLAKRKAKTLSSRESELLEKINQPILSAEDQKIYDQLYRQLQSEQINPEEHQELLDLITKREKKGVEKMTLLLELAHLKNISPKTLMKELGISAIAHG